jgi:hypothetical protein
MKNSNWLQLRDQSVLQDANFQEDHSVDMGTLTRGKLLLLTGDEPRLPNQQHFTLLVLIARLQ